MVLRVALGLVSGLVVALLFLSRRYRRYCDRAFRLYATLIDDPKWDPKIAEMHAYAEERLAELKAELESQGQRLQGRLPAELDVVCSGGGFKNCYSAGVLFLLHKHGAVTFKRFAGASAGAQLGFMAMAGQWEDALRWCLGAGEVIACYPYLRPFPFWDFFYRRQAHRAEMPSPGTFVASVTKIVSFIPPVGINRRVSTHDSKDDVGDALMATAAVPFLLCGLWCDFRGMRVLDGALHVLSF